MVESKLFMRQMGQPYPEGKNGVSLWDVEDIEQRQVKEKEHLERLMQMDGDIDEDAAGIDEIAEGRLDDIIDENEDEFDKEFGEGEDLDLNGNDAAMDEDD